MQFQSADSVLVVGGGATGVEMAAEIKTEYPDKKVRTTWPDLSDFDSCCCLSPTETHLMFLFSENLHVHASVVQLLFNYNFYFHPGGSDPLQNGAGRHGAAAQRQTAGQRGSAGERSGAASGYWEPV